MISFLAPISTIHYFRVYLSTSILVSESRTKCIHHRTSDIYTPIEKTVGNENKKMNTEKEEFVSQIIVFNEN